MIQICVQEQYDLVELFSGHTTWMFYSMLVRIYKHIETYYNDISSYTSSFSSYPGQIASADDYYTLDSGLVVIETSNQIINTSLYDKVKIESLLSWQRTTLANRLATDGETWSELFSIYNSGTYNNQWMVVNYQQWANDPTENVLWIAEQIPGLVVWGDQTEILVNQGYWASYNIPFYQSVYNMSGYGILNETAFSYTKCPRAQIFARNTSDIYEFNDFKALLRYNDYQNDPLSLGDPGNAPASRFDLEKKQPMPLGGYDTKATSVSLFFDSTSHAIYGPTTQQQAPFNWNDNLWGNWVHEGMAGVFDFNWEVMKIPHH